MKVLLIDAYDSFVYIVDHYLQTLGHDVDVIRCDRIDHSTLHIYDAVVLGPGPGHPTACGYLDVINQLEGKTPIMGICLGMQAIAEYYGVKVVQAKRRQHGKVSRITTDQKGCFSNLPEEINVTRYHSLVASRSEFTQETPLLVSAVSLLDGEVMGIRHIQHTIEGVQFHPESITTEYGLEMMKNFFDRC